jgi:hypothetical protein
MLEELMIILIFGALMAVEIRKEIIVSNPNVTIPKKLKLQCIISGLHQDNVICIRYLLYL